MDGGQEGNFCFLSCLNKLLLILYERSVVSGYYRYSKAEKGKKIIALVESRCESYLKFNKTI